MKEKLDYQTKIKQTMNYDMFKILDKNRTLTDGRSDKITNAMGIMDLSDCVPIIVDENMGIIDGQGRFDACKRRGQPIFYIQKDFQGKSEQAMRLLNTTHTDWSMKDYIEYWVKCDHAVYKSIIYCRDKYSVTLSTAIAFVTNSENTNGGDVQNGLIKAGKIGSHVFGEIINDFKGIFKDCNHVFFIRALVYIVKFKYYDHSIHFKKFQKNRHSLLGCATKEQYLKMFEDILNRSTREDKRVYIMRDYPRTK